MKDQYDNPWKSVLDALLPQALALLLPAAYKGIDWSRGWESLDKDLKKLFPKATASDRWADKLIRVCRRGGGEQIVFIHTEVQGDPVADFALRMFTTNYRIFDRYQKPVVSLAILGDDRPDWRPKSYGWTIWGCRAGIRFPSVKLWDYNDRWEELEVAAMANPFAVVVMAHLRTKATRKDPPSRYREKLRLIRRLYESGYERHEVANVLRFVDWVMTLPEALDDQLTEDLEALEAEKKMEYVTSFERVGMKHGKTAVLKRQLTRRFGELPERETRRLEAASSEELDLWSDRVLDAERLEEVFAKAPESTR